MKFRIVFGLITLIIALIALLSVAPGVLKIFQSSFVLKWPIFTLSGGDGYFFNYQNGGGNSSTSPTIKAGESIYKGRVAISNVSRYGYGQINLKASYFDEGKINVSGWKIKSLQRGETIIGKGFALPQFDAYNSNVELGKGEAVDIIVGQSPLMGNFRVNNCFGWLNNLYNLGYSFNYCPSVDSKTLVGLDSACQELILRSNNCKAPSADVLNNQTAKCREWSEKNLNYNACVSANMFKSDFYKGWKIYSGNNLQIYDPVHDRIEIQDQAGLLVDEYEY